MQWRKLTLRICRNERGAVLVLVGVLMIVLVGFAALAIDLGHLYVVRNELQNAADSGALAGAQNLYSDDPVSGLQILASTNQVAYDAALTNNSENLPVEVNWSGGNAGDVQRGHWSFSEHKFTPLDTLTPISLAGLSTAQLDVMDGTTAARSPAFVNAVKVTTRREINPATSFFAGIFGYDSFVRSAEAVGYIGFAGKLEPGEADQPIAICEESVLQTDPSGDPYYSCNIGRMINSGSNIQNNETGGWTDFNQESPCSGGTNSRDVRDQICGSGNSTAVQYGNPVATNGGEINSAFHDLFDCWQNHLVQSEQETGHPQPWEMTLPVVSCPGNNVSTCETVVGAVTVSIVWINDTVDPMFNNAPTEMGDWSSSDPSGANRWQDFANAFNLQNVDGTSAPYNQKSIYFLPSCEVQAPVGHTGGENFGVLAKYPVLVK
ncbi:MAG TPA: pilus assembly protein TadG-related protein [Geothermobacteraceae bacterium]|nr:pilus assembly protein TadG-related protein [Geothermobacteraceae bacterium]